jgi:hypothetical protein
MCPAWVSVVGSVTSLMGSCILAYPAWRVSRLLRKSSENTTPRTGEQESIRKPRAIIARGFQRIANAWTPELHRALLWGIGFMIVGGIASVWDTICSA